MADQDLHARVCVVESLAERHDASITDLYDKMGQLAVVCGLMPTIQKTLDRLDKRLDTTDKEVRGVQKVTWKEAGKLVVVIVILQVILTVIGNNLFREHFFPR